MPDWESLVRERLGADLSVRDEIVRELAGHLEDCYSNRLFQGESAGDALRWTLASSGDWVSLRHQIEREEASMGRRVRTLWVPGVVAFFVVQASLRLVQLLGYEPRTYFLRWPHPLQLYLPWLLPLPLIGALAALWSRRAGRPRGEWVLLSVFPSLVYAAFVAFFTVTDLLVDVLLTGNHGPMATFAGTWTFGLQFMVAPGLMLVLGALPVVLLAKGRQDGDTLRPGSREETAAQDDEAPDPPARAWRLMDDDRPVPSGVFAPVTFRIY